MTRRQVQNGGTPNARRDILNFIDVRTLQSARPSTVDLSKEIGDTFQVSLSGDTINPLRHNLKFSCQLPRHVQALNPEHMAYRVRFCQRILNESPESQLLCARHGRPMSLISTRWNMVLRQRKPAAQQNTGQCLKFTEQLRTGQADLVMPLGDS
jgi:hypothetical protein